MAKKDCFGSETYVCRTQDCPYMAECVQVVWEKKLRRVLAARRRGSARTDQESKSVRVRSRDFLGHGR